MSMSNSITRIPLSLRGYNAIYRIPSRTVVTAPPQEFNRRIVKEGRDVRPPSGALRLIYANLFRRNAVYFTLIIGSALVLTGGYNSTMDYLWDLNNKGKLFHDVVPKQFPNLPPGTEEAAGAGEGEEEESGGEESEE